MQIFDVGGRTISNAEAVRREQRDKLGFDWSHTANVT